MVYIGDLTQVNKDGDAINDPLVIEMQTKAAREGDYSFRCLPENGDFNCMGWIMHRVANSGSLVAKECESSVYENHKYSDFRFIQNQQCESIAPVDLCRLANVQVNGQYGGSEFTIEEKIGYLNLSFTSNLPVDILVEADNDWTYSSECSVTAGIPSDPAAGTGFIPFIPLNPDSKDHQTGPCRTASGSSGSNGKQYTLHSKKNIDECRQLCIDDDICLAFEARVNANHNRCEIWHELPAYAKSHAETWSCNVKQQVVEEEEDRSSLNILKITPNLFHCDLKGTNYKFQYIVNHHSRSQECSPEVIKVHHDLCKHKGQCTTWGDPHTVSFDTVRNDWGNTDHVVLTKTDDFEVFATLRARFDPDTGLETFFTNGNRISMYTSMTIQYKQTLIHINSTDPNALSPYVHFSQMDD
eukprot:Awhi_evm1s879